MGGFHGSAHMQAATLIIQHLPAKPWDFGCIPLQKTILPWSGLLTDVAWSCWLLSISNLFEWMILWVTYTDKGGKLLKLQRRFIRLDGIWYILKAVLPAGFSNCLIFQLCWHKWFCFNLLIICEDQKGTREVAPRFESLIWQPHFTFRNCLMCVHMTWNQILEVGDYRSLFSCQKWICFCWQFSKNRVLPE